MPADLFDDIERLRVRAQPFRSRCRPPRPAKGELYLGGPIPWAWISLAARQPGQALAVGLFVWLRAGLTKAAEVPVSLSSLEEAAGVKRDAARRGLQALEDVGLVSVRRLPGRRPVVTILSTASASPGSGTPALRGDAPVLGVEA